MQIEMLETLGDDGLPEVRLTVTATEFFTLRQALEVLAKVEELAIEATSQRGDTNGDT